MAQPIFSDLTSNPVDARFRMAPQADLDIPNNTEADYVQFHAYGGSPEPARGEIDDLVLAPDGNMIDGLEGKWEVNGGPLSIGTVDPSSPGMLQALAHLFGYYKFDVDTPATGVNQWRFGRTEATKVKPYSSLQVNNQITQITHYAGVLFTGVTFRTSPNSPFEVTFDYLWNNWNEFGLPTQETGTPDLPIVWGTYDEQWDPAATDSDLWMLVDTAPAGGGGLADVKFKISAAGTYHVTTTQEIVADVPLRVKKETLARLGSPGEQVKILYPTGSTLTALDEIKIPRRRAAWAESLPVRRPITSINTIFIADGEEIRIPQGYETTVAWDSVINEPDTAGAQGSVLLHGGALMPQISLTRPVSDLLYQKGLRTGSRVSTVIDAMTKTLIGSTIYEYRTLQVMPNGLVTGNLFGIQPGGRDRNESPVIIGKDPESTFVYDGLNFNDPFTVVVQNDVADYATLPA